MNVRDTILQRLNEGLSIENQLGYYRLIKYGLMKQQKCDEAKGYRELDKECVRLLKELKQ